MFYRGFYYISKIWQLIFTQILNMLLLTKLLNFIINFKYIYTQLLIFIILKQLNTGS